MADYKEFAQFYDVLMGDGSTRSARILDAIGRFDVNATSLLELGCGTGSVLEGLGVLPTLVGLDISPEMLNTAKSKVPNAKFVLGDMGSFELGDKFDVVACVFDTVNHLSTYSAWTSLFDAVAKHLRPGGLFIFDLNTTGRLHQLVTSPPWVHNFDGNTLIMDVLYDGDAVTVWDIRIFSPDEMGKFSLHRETIRELGVPLDVVRASLANNFELLLEEDDAGGRPTDESSRAYFTFRRRG